MTIRGWTAIAAAMVLSACAAGQGGIDQDLAKLKGTPLAAAVAKLGPPGAQQATAGGTVSTWSAEGRYNVPVTRTVTSYASGQPQTSTKTDFELRTETCTLNVSADGGGIITGIERRGSSSACAEMSDKLSGKS